MSGFMECRFCDRSDLTPQGHKSHETHCDENPNPEIPYDKQAEMDLLEKEETAESGHPNPDQSVSEGSDPGLPSVETLSGGKSEPETATDGGNRTCPLCGSGDVLDASEAKAGYIDAVEKPNPKAVHGYELADAACQNPECAALWGEKYDEPLPMSAVINA